MQANDITFFQRFQEDILAGRKTITIRDAAESHFKPGDVLRVGRYEDNGYFCTIAVTVTATSTVTLDTLTDQHAQQENMTLGQLRQVISDIYPGENQFYVIEFKTL
ncbi:N(4)-acetylcytidine aminohydrolase [Klebsiella sp. GG_Kp146]|uniref:N(4)-acetylcytidine aminohydrolase n=1 Tax=Klebsiella sp. GG_Kp146 TaxID=3153457 RepID=UPI0032B3A538